jgi:hypothetical protein
MQEGGAQTAEDAQAGHLDVFTERIGDEIDGMAQRRQRSDAVELGERGAPGLEERLGRDHQDVHARRPDRAGGVTKATCYTTPLGATPTTASE